MGILHLWHIVFLTVFDGALYFKCYFGRSIILIFHGYLPFVPYGIFGPQFVPLFLYSFVRRAAHLSNIVCLYLVACAVM